MRVSDSMTLVLTSEVALVVTIADLSASLDRVDNVVHPPAYTFFNRKAVDIPFLCAGSWHSLET